MGRELELAIDGLNEEIEKTKDYIEKGKEELNPDKWVNLESLRNAYSISIELLEENLILMIKFRDKLLMDLQRLG